MNIYSLMFLLYGLKCEENVDIVTKIQYKFEEFNKKKMLG